MSRLVSKFGKSPSLPKNIQYILNRKKRVYKLLKTNPSLKERYKSLEKDYKKAVKNHLKTVEEKIANSGNIKYFYSFVKKKLHSSSTLPPLLNNNGQLLLEPSEKANALNYHYSTVTYNCDQNSFDFFDWIFYVTNKEIRKFLN